MSESRGLLHAPVWRVRYGWWSDDDDGENTEYVVAASAQDACAFVTEIAPKNSSIQSVDRVMTVEITRAVIDKLLDARQKAAG